MFKNVIGFLALIVNCVQQLPQVHKTYQTKKVDDLSANSLILILVTSILWTLHGYIIEDMILLTSGVITSMINMILLILYVIYKYLSTKTVDKEEMKRMQELSPDEEDY